MTTEFNVDKYRDPDECRPSWNLRRRFLLAHQDKFPEDRLVCLAQCFVNVELFGNKYPAGVMVQLNELAKDLPELAEERKQRTKSKFTTMSFVKGTSEDSTNQTPQTEVFSPSKAQTQIGFVKAGSEYQSTDIKSSTYQDVNQATSLPSGNARAHFIMEDAPSKKKSKKKKESIIMENTDSDQTFALLRHHLKQMAFPENPISILNMALQKTKNIVQSEFKNFDLDKGIKMFECTVLLDGINIASSSQQNKKLAKKTAFEKTIKAIIQPYHKIVVNDSGSKELQTSETSFEEHKQESEQDLELLPQGELTYETNAMNIGNHMVFIF